MLTLTGSIGNFVIYFIPLWLCSGSLIVEVKVTGGGHAAPLFLSLTMFVVRRLGYLAAFIEFLSGAIC